MRVVHQLSRQYLRLRCGACHKPKEWIVEMNAIVVLCFDCIKEANTLLESSIGALLLEGSPEEQRQRIERANEEWLRQYRGGFPGD